MTGAGDLIPSSGRWTAKRKTALVRAVAAGELRLAELIDAGVSLEEFIGWEKRLASRGGNGLRVSKPGQHRAHEAALRRLCARLGVSHMLSRDGAAISCGRCGMTSHNVNDVANRYCGNCKVFLDEGSPYDDL